MAERTCFQSMSQKRVLSLGPANSIWEAACAMTRPGFPATRQRAGTSRDTTAPAEIVDPSPIEMSPVMIAALTIGLRVKKETIGEITAAAQVMREFATRVPIATQ